MEDFDAIIIGSGQGGNPLADALTAAGKKTAMVERGDVGKGARRSIPIRLWPFSRNVDSLVSPAAPLVASTPVASGAVVAGSSTRLARQAANP